MISLSKVEEKLYRPADAYEQSRVTRLEHVNTTIVETPKEGIATVAARIAKLITRTSTPTPPPPHTVPFHSQGREQGSGVRLKKFRSRPTVSILLTDSTYND